MTDTDDQPRARPVWPWIAALVVLAVVAPLLALLLRDQPGDNGTDDGAQGVLAGSSGSPSTAGSPADEPSDVPTPEPTPLPQEPTPAPTDLPTPEPTPSSEPAKGNVRALFFGDSYFVGAGYTDESNSMARLASNRLGWSSEVNGASGVGFVHALPEFGLPNYLGLIRGGAFNVGPRQWVVIEGGSNDVYEPLDAVNREARRVIRIAQRRFPGATIALMGPMDSDGDFTETRPVVRELRKVAARRGVAFINANRWMVGHYDLIGPDGSHPYPKGHRIASRKLARALQALGA